MTSLTEESTKAKYGTVKKQEEEEKPEEMSHFKLSSLNLFGSIFRSKKQSLINNDELENRYKSTGNKRNNDDDDDEIILNKMDLPHSSSSTLVKSSSSLNSITKIISTDSINTLTTVEPNHRPSPIFNFSICYNSVTSTLFVNVISLENLPSVEARALDLNVYVRVEIKLPNSYLSRFTSNSKELEAINAYLNKMAKTRSIRSNVNPVYDETFEFDNFRYLSEMANDGDDDGEADNHFRAIFLICNLNQFGRDQIIGQLEHKFLASELLLTESNRQSYACRIYSNKLDLINTVIKCSIILFDDCSLL